MNLLAAIKQQKRKNLFVSLSQRPGRTGTVVYNTIFQRFQIDAEYVACECTDLKSDIELVRKHCAGASISMPYKIPVSDLVDVNYSPFTPVNTITNKNGHLAGYNCDLLGLIDLLRNKIASKTVIILGDGAMSQNIQLICYHWARQCRVYNRSNWSQRHQPADILINTTSIGMNDKECPVDEILCDLVVDCVIGNTELINLAARKNKQIISGKDIYLAQLRHQCRLYTELKIDNLSEYLP